MKKQRISLSLFERKEIKMTASTREHLCQRTKDLDSHKNLYTSVLSNFISNSWKLKTISSVQSLSHVRLFATPWATAHQASLSITNCQSSPKPMSIESVMPSSHRILCLPLLLLPSVFPSIRNFSNKSALHIRWPKYWSFSFDISPSSEHSGLISFRMDWLDLLAVQGTLKSLLQHHSSKVSILQCSAFFLVQLSHPYMTTGKWVSYTEYVRGMEKHCYFDNQFKRKLNLLIVTTAIHFLDIC